MPQNQPSESAAGIYRRLLRYSSEHKLAFGVAIFGMLAFAAADGAFMWLVKPLLDGSFGERDPKIIEIMPFAIMALFLIRGIGGFLSEYFMAFVGRNVINKLRGQLFQHLLVLPTSYYDANASGELISRITFNTERVAEAATTVVTSLVKDVATASVMLFVMFYQQWKLALLILVVGPIIAAVISLVNNRFRRYSRNIQNTMSDITHVAHETIDGQREVKAFGGQKYAVDQFERSNRTNLKAHLRLALTRASSVATIQIIASVPVALIIYFATSQDLIGSMSAGAFVSFMGATISILPPIKRLTNVNAVMQQGIVAAESIFEMLAEPLEKNTGQHTASRVSGSLQIKNVGFSYAGTDKQVLDNISLDVESGKTVALVGHSGSGKTTLASLIPRFYDHSSGSIKLDGVELNDYALENLRSQIALVGQHVTLFNDTIRNNIAYGRADSVSDSQVVAAAKAANAWEFIQQQEHGLNTMVGEDGVLLSGGQRQRLAIARALLKDAPVLILDEATSALDTKTERIIQNALDGLMKGRTTLVIAHRLSTIEKADSIVVMDAGRIIEQGTHAELLAKDGNYAALYKMQFSEVN